MLRLADKRFDGGGVGADWLTARAYEIVQRGGEVNQVCRIRYRMKQLSGIKQRFQSLSVVHNLLPAACAKFRDSAPSSADALLILG